MIEMEYLRYKSYEPNLHMFLCIGNRNHHCRNTITVASLTLMCIIYRKMCTVNVAVMRYIPIECLGTAPRISCGS